MAVARAASFSPSALPFSPASRTALVSALMARSRADVVPMMPATRASSTRDAASTGPLFRRTNFRSR